MNFDFMPVVQVQAQIVGFVEGIALIEKNKQIKNRILRVR